jgi:hypothetical protein
MRIKIPTGSNTQVSRRLTYLSMAAYSRGDMRVKVGSLSVAETETTLK